MTTTSVNEAARPRLNITKWGFPQDNPERPGSEEFSPRSPKHDTAESNWEEQKESQKLWDITDEQSTSINISIPPLATPTRDSMGSMSSDMLEELRKIIKEEVCEVAQVAQLRNSEAVTPIDTFRFSPCSSQNSVFTPSYPTPPQSDVEPFSQSKASSPVEQSPEVAHTSVAQTSPLAPPQASVMPSLSQSQDTAPISSQQKAVRFRNRGPPVIHCQPRVEPEAVSPTAAISPQVELSSVDKAWGVLFDSDGFPTQRLSSVLRGLAKYMILEFEPGKSLVITPEKMLAFYTKYKVEPERFQYEDIFRSCSTDALERIEFLYQDLDCQYYLTQSNPRLRPNVPSLTPDGFAKWMVSNILAYPDPESRRLHAITSSLPLNADSPIVNGKDSKTERLPRQLSRHLFPEQHDKKVRKILDEAIWDCLEDATPPLPSIPHATRPRSESLTGVHLRQPTDDWKRPRAPPYSSRTYDRRTAGTDSLPARLPRSNSDAGSSGSRHRDLPPPPIGRYSLPQRQRSPPPMNRYSSSLPVIPHHAVSSTSSAHSAALSSNTRENEGNYGMYSRQAGGRRPRDESPRSPGFGRRCLGGDRGPTWEEVYSRTESGTRGSADAGLQRLFR
ncbi:uncharacterized protein CTRU02_203695 [Colletotrichum truncatum]|uniref:Uncharacterized protein n=1 Tax=Colletotrichum truncatum TaxID=5467 RepID=A0ACC3ZA16_COLTU|nr:uncharacterized protein CTRU02_04027 [Colletotrichum truncatum]KAF6796067.1 hypothetical protein CTRU02_04027 [Colletotrichum truncatum]